MFDENIKRLRRNRAAASWAKHSALKQAAADLLADRLLDIRKEFHTAADLCCGGGEMARAMSERGRLPEMLLSCDMSPDMPGLASASLSCVASDELLPLASGSFDLITSVCALHHVTDLPGALIQIRAALQKDGLFLGCFIGGESLQLLRSCLQEAEQEITGGVSPRVSPMVDLRDLGGLLQRASFALPVVDMCEIELTHTSLFHLLADIRGMGESNCLESRLKHPTRRSIFIRTAQLYQERAHQTASPDDDDPLTSARRLVTPIQLLCVHGWNLPPA